MRGKTGEVVCRILGAKRTRRSDERSATFSRKCDQSEVKDSLKAVGETRYQEFPVSLVTKSGKRDEDSVRIVHLLDHVTCIDKKASDFEVSKDDEDHICAIHSLVFDKSRIPHDRHIFKLAEHAETIVVSATLAARWQDVGVRGAAFIKPEEFSSILWNGIRHKPGE